MPEEKSGQNSAPAQSGFKWELEQEFLCRVDARTRLRVGYGATTDRHRWSVDDIHVCATLAEGVCESATAAMRAAELAFTAINRRSLKLVWLASLSWSAFTGRIGRLGRSARIEARDHHYEFRVYERTPPVYLHLSKGEARSLDEAMRRCEELLCVSSEVAHVG